MSIYQMEDFFEKNRGMTQMEKPKAIFLHKPAGIGESSAIFLGALEPFASVGTLPMEETLDAASVIEANAGVSVFFIDSEYAELAESIAATIKIPNSVYLISDYPLPYLNENSKRLQPLLPSLPFLVTSAFGEEGWKKVLPQVLAEATFSGLANLAAPDGPIITHKLQSLDDIGWALDIVHFYLKSMSEKESLKTNETRQAISGLLGFAMDQAQESGAERPTIALEIYPGEDVLAVSIRFPFNFSELKGAIEQVISADNIPGFNAWQTSDLIQFNLRSQEKEFEIISIISYGRAQVKLSFNSIVPRVFLNASAAADPSILESIKFRPLDTILEDIPEERRKSPLNANQNSLNQEKENAVAKLMHRKSQVVQQLSQRIEQEQAVSQERQKKVSELLLTAKTELEAARKELNLTKGKIKYLEKALGDSRVAKPEEISESSEKAMSDINNSLRSANADKATAEEKLEMYEKKISLLEKKYANSLKEVQEKEKELTENRSVVFKITKELEAAQQSLKLQSQNVPVQLNNEEYEKKIKTLNTKIYEQQQKESELQTLIKKMNLKLEQSEIGRKSGKNENEGKMKLLEKQVEQAKSKEKELMKKIDELTAALKKVKNTKAA